MKTNAIDYSQSCRMGRSHSVRNLTRDLPSGECSRIWLLREASGNGRNLAIQPILLVGQRSPGVRHARIALVRRLSFGALSELKTIVGVISEDVRLFHGKDVGTELPGCNALTAS